MSEFPIVQKMDEEVSEDPFFVEYSITAKGWRATGNIKYDPNSKRSFWSLLQMVVESVMRGDENQGVLNESYTDGFSRYLAPVDFNKSEGR